MYSSRVFNKNACIVFAYFDELKCSLFTLCCLHDILEIKINWFSASLPKGGNAKIIAIK